LDDGALERLTEGDCVAEGRAPPPEEEGRCAADADWPAPGLRAGWAPADTPGDRFPAGCWAVRAPPPPPDIPWDGRAPAPAPAAPPAPLPLHPRASRFCAVGAAPELLSRFWSGCHFCCPPERCWAVLFRLKWLF